MNTLRIALETLVKFFRTTRRSSIQGNKQAGISIFWRGGLRPDRLGWSFVRGTLAGLLAWGLIGAGVAWAEGEAPEPTVAAVSAPEVVTSSPVVSAVRDPFWPIGYVPPAPPPVGGDATGNSEELKDVAWPTLPVRGRSRAPDGTYRVLVDGVGVVGEKQIVTVCKDGLRFHWRINRIDEAGVQAKRLGISKDKSPSKPPVETATSRKEKEP